MDKYLNKSYYIDGEIWTEEDFSAWANINCKKGKHLFDEVLSVSSHYLYCDACEKVDYNFHQEVKKISQMDFFISRLGNKEGFVNKLIKLFHK